MAPRGTGKAKSGNAAKPKAETVASKANASKKRKTRRAAVAQAAKRTPAKCARTAVCPPEDYVLRLQTAVSELRDRVEAGNAVTDFLLGLICGDEKGRNDSAELRRVRDIARHECAPCPMCWGDFDANCSCPSVHRTV